MKKLLVTIIVLLSIIIGFLLPYSALIKVISSSWSQIFTFITSLAGPLVAGLILWFLGLYIANKKIKQDAITDLMTYRTADSGNTNFRLSLNKVAVVFHNDSEIQQDVKHLYEVANNQSLKGKIWTNTVVSLVFKLCQKNGFYGLTESDIRQSFLDPDSQNPESVAPDIMIDTPQQKKRKTKKTSKKNQSLPG